MSVLNCSNLLADQLGNITTSLICLARLMLRGVQKVNNDESGQWKPICGGSGGWWVTTKSRVNSKKFWSKTWLKCELARLTAKEHHDDGVKLLRIRVWSYIAKPHRDQGREAEVERRAIPGLHFVFLYLSVFLYFFKVCFRISSRLWGAWIRVW